MKGLKRAGLLLAAGVLLQFVVPRRGHILPEAIVLPSTARFVVEGADEGGVCRSDWMFYALARRTIGPLVKAGTPYDGRMDYVIRCRSEKSEARLSVLDWNDVLVTEAVEPSAGAADTSVRLAVKLARDPRLIASVIGLYQDDAFRSAKIGAEQWGRGEWEKAAANFFFALESDVNPVPMYFGLYETHAKLGNVAKAYWYLLCFLRESGKTPLQLEDRQLAALRGLDAPSMLKAAMRAPPVRLEVLFAAREGRINELAHVLRDTAALAPWDLRVHDALITLYEGKKWHELSRAWRARRDTAAAVGAPSFQLAYAGMLGARLRRR